jgi:alpha-amylase/alpha-mannosidase (GH57 family)
LSHLSNYVCIHGHFYQPPRENPFTGEVAEQPSAAPWHDWNARITEESYAANARARVLGDKGEVVREINNYERISFDFGPTLLSWLEKGDPDTYRAVIEADAASARRFGGHGSALAQAYNHSILPLSNSRDRVTQVRWGIADFRRRFGREPEGMWLPETAVDMESLDVLAREGIRFTILAPHQAAAVESDQGSWAEVMDGSVDTRIPYLVDLGHGRAITVFFYDGPLSREIAFDGVLEDGYALAARLLGSIGEPGEGSWLAHVATDGETYGHHHRHGEMALAVALEAIEAGPEARLTNYPEYLAAHPPTRKASIAEDSSWSCAHGVERWRADCGCKTGREPTGHQRWRAPLRLALDWLRDQLVAPFESMGADLLTDPWKARDEYISVVLGDSPAPFLDEHARPGLDVEGRRKALGLLEIQEHAMLMYTSCGWFFDDISGLETVFVLRHAGWVCALAREFLGVDLEPELKARLEAAPSNVGGVNGRVVYEQEVSPYVSANGIGHPGAN